MDASSVTSSGDGNEDVLIRSTSIDSEQRAAVIDKMLEKYSLADTDILNNNDVSASVGSDLQRSAFICSILAILLMLVYITFRFELTSGLAAICCLVHDLLVMLSVYVLLQIPLDSNFIAAALTILGYSINASIIVFDRVRENLRTARKEPFEVIGEKSIWQTMGRTINTTLTTLFTIGMVYISVFRRASSSPAADRRSPGRRLVCPLCFLPWSVGLLPVRSSAGRRKI